MANRLRVPGAASPCASAGRCRSRTAQPLIFLVLLTLVARSAGSPTRLHPVDRAAAADVHRQPLARPAVAAVVHRLRLRLFLRAARSTSRRSACASSGGPAVTFAIALLIMVTSFRRSRLGVSGPLGESMFIDLRDRISKQGNLPDLPHRVAGRVGGEVGGRHLVRRRLHRGPALPGRQVRAGVVDVSGKGVEAGPRSLFLSGAFNGIVSALPGEQFLPAANDYLMGQDWDEGFATAIHLHLDLAPATSSCARPVTRRRSGCTRARVAGRCSTPTGPALGLIDDTDFDASGATCAPATACCCSPTDSSRPPSATSPWGWTSWPGLGSGCAARIRRRRQPLIDSMEQTQRRPGAVVVHRRWGPRTSAPVRDLRGPLWHDGPRPRRPGAVRGCSSMVEPQSSKLMTRVRFPSSALRSPRQTHFGGLLAGRSVVASAPALGAGDRRFESCRPDCHTDCHQPERTTRTTRRNL